MMKKKILAALFVCLGFFLHARDFPEKSNTYTVYINYEEYSVRANVLNDAGRIHPKMGHTYYWYAENDIKNTQGGFDGKLLHGEYKSFYRNRNLREQGNFSHGLKEGVWKTWFVNGKIHEIMNYKNGLEQGAQEIFDEAGNIISRTNYRNGLMNGKMVSYHNGELDTTIVFRNGKPQPAKLPKPNRKMENGKNKITTEKDSTKSGEQKNSKGENHKPGFNLKNIFNENDKQKVEHPTKEVKRNWFSRKEKQKGKKDPNEKKKKPKRKNDTEKDQASTKKT